MVQESGLRLVRAARILSLLMCERPDARKTAEGWTMDIELSEIWDFHTDLRLIQRVPEGREYLTEQIDLAGAAALGGVFTATGRNAEAPKDVQWSQLEKEVALIRGAEGLEFVLARSDLAGAGNQLLHAEGVYFVQDEADIGVLGKLRAMGFRSLAPMYNEDNALGGGAEGDPARGLTPLGRSFMMSAWREGFILDCAHANHRTKGGMIDLALVTGSVLHYSHGHLGEPVEKSFMERGLPKEEAERIFETGGLVGLTPHPGFVGAFERHLEEIDYLAGLSEGQVAMGTDFAGTNRPGPAGNRMFDDFPGARGYRGFAARLAKIHGEDFARAYCGRTLKGYLEGSLPSGTD
jgi:microsomal dipeptidase-like Zn-dependent dipeptidase